jgi:hypothetical protein
MEADDRFTVEAESGQRRIEVGVASWDGGDGSSLSVRHHVRNSEGGFDPYSSGEIPIELVGPMVDAVRIDGPPLARPGSPHRLARWCWLEQRLVERARERVEEIKREHPDAEVVEVRS